MDDIEWSDDRIGRSSDLDDAALDRGVITTSRNDRVGELLERVKAKTLTVNPKFQRHAVWGRDRQSKLIESLLLNIPIPMLYIAEDEDGTQVVVDGQQRLRAIDEFVAGHYALQRLDILSALNGKRWPDLSAEQGAALLGRALSVVVIAANSPATLRFEMFERLSAGGLPLNEQELRNCVFRGPFNDLLHELVRTAPWLEAVGKPDADLRMRHEELALRFFALRSVVADYRPPVKHVLNEFMRLTRSPEAARIHEKAALFERALTNCLAVFGEHCFRRVVQANGRPQRWETNLNRAVYDVQMLGLADISSQTVREEHDMIRRTFNELCLTNAEFKESLGNASVDRKAFYGRLRLWLFALREAGIDSPLIERLPRA